MLLRRLFSFFKHHRHVEQRNGEPVFKLAPLRKSIDSLGDLRQLTHAANERYLAFMACLDNPDAGQKALAKMTAPTKVKGRSYRSFDLFLDPDYRLFLTLARGEWAIFGVRTGDLRQHIPGLTPGRSSYLIKRLRTHGLIKQVAHSYNDRSTTLGRRVIVTALVIREYCVQPSLVRNSLSSLCRFVEDFADQGLRDPNPSLPRAEVSNPAPQRTCQ